MARFDQRQGFLLSALVHLVILMSLASHPRLGGKETAPSPEPSAGPRVFLPPPAVLRKLTPAPLVPVPPRAVPPPAPRPTPPPPDAKLKDRISIGPPSAEKPKTMILRKEDDLTATPKGKPNATPATPPPVPLERTPESVAKAGGAVETPQTPGFRVPPGALGDLPRGEDGSRKGAGPQQPSIASSLRELDRRLQEEGPRGLPTGTGQKQMGGLMFDPEGADFTAWINHWKNEVYRNWIVPQPALLGFRGHVDIEFVVERNGSVSSIRLVKSAGQPALDRAAENALRGGQFLPLPSDYGPPRLTINVSFYYNEGPAGS